MLDMFLKRPTLRRFVFKAFRIYSYFNRFYFDHILHKRKSKEIFTDALIPIGTVRLSILKGLGIPDKKLKTKPFVAVCNSFCEINPGHKHLRQIVDAIKSGIYDAGGIPYEFGVPGPCDGIANGNEGMRFILPQRDLIADIVEMYIRSQCFDGVVLVSSCDKINPGMIMASARLDLPTIFVGGGHNIMKIRYKPYAKSINHKDYEGISDKILTATSATCGACELVTTANTIQLLIEAMGLSLPFSSACPAFSSDKLSYAYQSGVRIVELIKANLTVRKILNEKSLENAIMVCLAIGGSTNSALHIPAIAYNLGIEMKLNIFNKFNKIIPTLCGIAPNGPYGVYDLFMAGGIPAVMKMLKDNLHLDCLSVSGKNISSIIKEANVLNSEVIRSKENPYFIEGGIVVLFGNLAPEGCIIKQSAVSSDMRKFTGTAVVFESEQETINALIEGKIQDGNVVITRYEGPKGGPGMPEMLSITTLIDLLGLKKVALITDGRFSGATAGPCIGHISPEAYEGGNIALVKNGDKISIDIPERKLHLHLEDKELGERRILWKPLVKDAKSDFLKRYREKVSSASCGAVLK